MCICTIGRFSLLALALVAINLALTVASPSAQASPFAFSGDVTARGIFFLEEISDNTNNQLYQSTLNFIAEKEFAPDVKFISHIAYTADPTNKSESEQNYLDLPEFNIKWRHKPFLFKLGTDIYSWGVTDAVNPVDLINTRQYYDPIHSIKMGATGISIGYSAPHFDVDMVYIPSQRSPLLPGGNSRWLPREEYSGSATTFSNGEPYELLLPNNFTYGFSELPELDHARENNVAVRLQGHLPDLELALYGYDGIAPIPVVQPVANGNLLSFSPTFIYAVTTITLLVQDYRQQTGGASFVKTLGSWQVKGEGAWTQPSADAPYKGWSDTAVFAIEKNWNVGADATLLTVVQYATSQQGDASSNGVDSLSHIFDSNWMFGGHFTWRDKDQITTFFSQDVIRDAWLVDLRYERALFDNVTFGVGASLLGGPISSALGVYSHNKNLSADLKYSF